MDRPTPELREEVAVVVVPLPAQGHLNQLLHFSLLLSSHGLAVHYAAPATHVRQAKTRIQGWSSTSIETVHFHDLPLPPFPTPPPDPNSTTKFPSHLQPLFDATAELRSPFAALLRSLSSTARRLVVVHEPLMSFAGHEAAQLPNAETYSFICVSAIYGLSVTWPSLPNPSSVKPELLDYLTTPFRDSVTEEFWDFVSRQDLNVPGEAGTVINSCRAIEGEFIDLYAHQRAITSSKLFAVGPLNPVVVREDGGRSRHEVLRWLDGQPPDSVLYVSFGTMSPVSDSEIEQLAAGLRRSGQRFVWVLREADRADIFAGGAEGGERKLLPGFEKEVAGTGMVVRGWAPQLEILAHRSTGGFMSHCGWNSCMESLGNGVPILAWPMASDQPGNAMLVTKYLKVGAMVRDWARRNEAVPSETIEEVIKRVMACDEGKEMRKRAKTLREAVRQAISDGGTSKEDLISFINHIKRS